MHDRIKALLAWARRQMAQLPPARALSYAATVALSLALLSYLQNSALADYTPMPGVEEMYVCKAQVLSVEDRQVERFTLDGVTTMETVNITFRARLSSGGGRGMEVTALQANSSVLAVPMKEVEPGDRVLLYDMGDDSWLMGEYVRTDGLLGLGLFFFFCLVLFGRAKGVNTILSLVLTCWAIFGVFIPMILTGRNIYLWAVLVCVYVVVMTLLIVSGPNRKSLAASAGCLGGILVTGLLTVWMDRALHLTGMVDDESMYLMSLNPANPLDLKGVIFGGIIIGAMGATMDVAISIASSLEEIRRQAAAPSFRLLLRAGFSIGRDIMGTMSNTLVLAYIGSSLSVVLLLTAYNNSLLGLLNREMLVVEMLQTLVGSLGILFTIPLTSLVSAAIYMAAPAPPALGGGSSQDTDG